MGRKSKTQLALEAIPGFIPEPNSEELALAEQICEALSDGSYLTKIFDELNSTRPQPMARSTWWRWCEKYPSIRSMYARAQIFQLDAWCSENIKIADDCSSDLQPFETTRTTKNGSSITEKGIKSDNTAVNRARLRIQTREWQMCRLGAAKYGDKIQQQISGKDGKELSIIVNIRAKTDNA